MSKTTKIIATIIAVAVVLAGMLVAIYAATSGSAGITATVSWTASQGIDLEFWANANGGTTASGATNTIAVQSITQSTTNTNAAKGNVGSLSRSFSDTTEDGINNPSALTFNYYIKNKAITPLNVKVTTTPSAGVESVSDSGSGLVHTPRVELSASINDVDNASALTGVLANDGYDVAVGATLKYTVVLSMATGGTNNGVNADISISSFNANVAFNFSLSSTASVQTAPVLSISGVTSTSNPTVGSSLSSYLDTVVTDKSTTCGWFFDSGLTQGVSDDYFDKNISNATNLSLYTATASDLSNFTFTDIDANTCSVKASSDSISGDIVIPAYNSAGKKVVTITYVSTTDAGFINCADITSVTIPNTITSLGSYTFRYCSSLTTINIPNGVTMIGNCLFNGCVTLTSIIIPNSVTKIDTNAFNGCSSLTDITIPNSVTSIGNGVFRNCSRLTSITIPNSVASIGSDVFYSCSSLISIIIPNSVTSIVSSAFRDCSGLTSVIIGSSVASIGNYAFRNCSGLTSITIPNSVISIGSSVFSGCSGLTSISVASGNTVYDSRNNCNAIIETSTNKLIAGCKNTTIPSGVTSIGSYAFSGCSGLTSIIIPDSVTSIEDYAFFYCSSLAEIVIPNGVLSIGLRVFEGCGKLTSVTIPNSVTSIGYSAFQNTGITSVTIPNSVISIGKGAFKFCSKLTSVTFENTSGWSTGGTALSSSDLENTSTAATYLKTTYISSDWTRS